MKQLVAVLVIVALALSFLSGLFLAGTFASWKIGIVLSLLFFSFLFGVLAIYVVFLLGKESVEKLFDTSVKMFFVKPNKSRLWVIHRN